MRKLFLSILAIHFLLLSCKKKEVEKPAINDSNHFVYELMKEWYYWNDKMPIVDPDSYASPESLLDALKYKAYDRWSYITDSATFARYFNSGETIGYGCGLALDAHNKLFISYVYDNSPMDDAGITRGYEITHINGSSVNSLIAYGTINQELVKDGLGVSTAFTVVSPTGVTSNINVAKEELHVNTVLHYEVKNVGTKKVGYLVFNSFVQTSEQELQTAFDYFAANSISELILDLRYNGGGLVDVANYLSSCIGGSHLSGQVFGHYKFNSKRAAQYDTTYTFETTSYNLGLTRLFVITSGSTASSSELVINNLMPYMDVVLVGSKTHGKPVGMLAWPYKGFVVMPITFSMVNKNLSGNYFSGIPVNSTQVDDLIEPFGSADEDCMKAALSYIEFGNFGGTSAKFSSFKSMPSRGGFRDEVGCY